MASRTKKPGATPTRAGVSAGTGSPPDGAARRRRTRLQRGAFVIGEPSPAIDPQLAAGDPYRADTVIDGGSVFGLSVRAASVRGLAKRWAGGPRQDDMCLARHEPTRALIAAVADGVSGAERSHVGASLVVRHAVGTVARQLDEGRELDWGEVFDHAAWALVDAQRSFSGDPRASVDDAARMLATTLVVAVVHAPADRSSACEVELAGVGDSPAMVLARRRFGMLLGEGDAPALLGGTVEALPRSSSPTRPISSARCALRAKEVLLLATDGFALPLAGGGNDVGAVFARELARPPEIIDFARLLDFSRSTYDDDRTLVAIWPPAR